MKHVLVFVNQIIPIETSYLHKISLINVWKLQSSLCQHILLPPHVPSPSQHSWISKQLLLLLQKQHESGLQENLIRCYKRTVREANRHFDACEQVPCTECLSTCFRQKLVSARIKEKGATSHSCNPFSILCVLNATLFEAAPPGSLPAVERRFIVAVQAVIEVKLPSAFGRNVWNFPASDAYFREFVTLIILDSSASSTSSACKWNSAEKWGEHCIKVPKN